MSRADELKRLIAEQKKDDTHRVFHERNVVAYLGKGELYLSNEGPVNPIRRTIPECAIHGREDMRITQRGDVWCSPCDKIRKAKKRKAQGVKPRGTCRHGDSRKTRECSDGKQRCIYCQYEAQQRRKQRRKNGTSSR